jgi:hypothetical protein
MCQKAVGGPFAAFAPVRLRDFSWTRGQPAMFQSSSVACRDFCPACGTPLTFRYLKKDWIDVTIGSLDRPAEVVPIVHYGTESRLAWLDDLDALPTKITGENNPPEDLASIRNYQHLDDGTPDSWAPPKPP